MPRREAWKVPEALLPTLRRLAAPARSPARAPGRLRLGAASLLVGALLGARLMSRAPSHGPDDERRRELRRILACDGRTDDDGRRECFHRLLRHLRAWPLGSDRDAAMREADEALTPWTPEQRTARAEALLDARGAVDVTLLARGVNDHYPDDTDRDPGRASWRIFGSTYASRLESYSALRASISLDHLAQGPGAPRLVNLQLNSSLRSDARWDSLRDWPGRHTLRVLALVDEPTLARREDFWRFCDSAPSLRELRLGSSGSGESLRTLLDRPALSGRLEALGLSHCLLRDDHLELLIANRALAHLRQLDLRQNRGLSREGVARLKEAPQFANTEVLSGPWPR
ncbi:MAG: hypothetical protein R3A48_23115 [Polyangiales bacterium]